MSNNLYSITFIDSKTNRMFNYYDVVEVNFRKERTIIKCKEKLNDIFCTVINKDEYDKIIIEEEEINGYTIL